MKLLCNSRHLWRITHFLGSFVVFALVCSLFWSVGWMSAGGAYEGFSANELELAVGIAPIYGYFMSNFPLMVPVSSLVAYLFPDIAAEGAAIVSFGFALDMVIWFNLLLYAVQAILFLPSWLFGFFEGFVKDKGDTYGR